MSQADLARATGLSRTYIKAIEDGIAKEPSARTIGLLARALDTDLIEIMEASGALPPNYHESPIESDKDLTMYLRRQKNLSEQSVSTIMRIIHLSELDEHVRASSGDGKAAEAAK
jgi:transcriptional regulator with XRE-family HTH domain